VNNTFKFSDRVDVATVADSHYLLHKMLAIAYEKDPLRAPPAACDADDSLDGTTAGAAERMPVSTRSTITWP
jgi:hypothetical protein